MADTVKMRLIKGKHQAIDKDGNRYDMKVGEVTNLTPDQARAFKDKFEPAEAVEARLKAQKAAEEAQLAADAAAVKADAIASAEEKLTEANAELAAAKDDAAKKAATDKVNAAKKALEEAKK